MSSSSLISFLLRVAVEVVGFVAERLFCFLAVLPSLLKTSFSSLKFTLLVLLALAFATVVDDDPNDDGIAHAPVAEIATAAVDDDGDDVDDDVVVVIVAEN